MLFDNTAPSTPSAPLRPRTVMELLDATFRIYRENLVAFLTLSAIVIIPLNILNLLLDTSQAASSFSQSSSTLGRNTTVSGGDVGLVCGAAILAIALTLAQTVVLNGVFAHMASERQFGKKLSLGEAWAGARPRLSTLLWAYIWFYILMTAMIFAISLAGVFCGVLFVLFGIVFYLAITVGAFIAPVAMLENGSSGSVFGRANALAKSRFWQVFGLSVMIGLISFILTFAFSALLSAIFLSNTRVALSNEGQIISAAITTIITIFTAPLLPIAMTLMYYDTRIRSEGLDLALQTLGPDARPAMVGAPPVTEGLINSKDLVNILVMVGAVVVFALVFGGAIYSLLNIVAPGLGNLPIGQ